MIEPIDVVFPCLNEEEALPSLLAALPPRYRAIVVDNGSTDATAEVARRAGARVVDEPRRGYGAAVKAGLEAATSELVVVCDGDGTIDPRQFDAVVRPVDSGAADLTIGHRRPTSRSAWPFTARVANRVLARLIRSRTGVPLYDLGPVRAAYRVPLLELGVTDRRSGYPVELVLRAHRQGWRLQQVAVDYLPRVGRSKVTGSVRGYLTAVRDVRRQLTESAR